PPSPGPILTTSPDSTSPYTLSLHAALPIYVVRPHIRRSGFLARQGHHARHSLRVQQVQGSPLRPVLLQRAGTAAAGNGRRGYLQDRKSTRLNSSHVSISYAVFCLKKTKLHA